MTLVALAWAQMRHAPLDAVVGVMLTALGTATLLLLGLLSDGLQRPLSRDARGVDLVVGAKGSPLQLVLSSVYHADVPTGNIALPDARRWATDSRVALAVPLALGDSYAGYRIVGTEPSFLSLHDAVIAQGRGWQAPMEAVIGADLAREQGLRLGSRLIGAHGYGAAAAAHDAHAYTVVGILAPQRALIDRLLLTSLDSVWEVHGRAASDAGASPPEAVAEAFAHRHEDAPLQQHEHGHEHGHEQAMVAEHHGTDAQPQAPSGQVTALLIRYASPLAATSLPLQINAESALQAASPAQELSRLLRLVGVGVDGLQIAAALLMLVAGLSVMASLYAALRHRRHDLALMRSLGASRYELLLGLLIEGLLRVLPGAVLGAVLAHGGQALIAAQTAARGSFALQGGRLLLAEAWVLAAVLLLGLLAAALPAWQASRQDVAPLLR